MKRIWLHAVLCAPLLALQLSVHAAPVAQGQAAPLSEEHRQAVWDLLTTTKFETYLPYGVSGAPGVTSEYQDALYYLAERAPPEGLRKVALARIAPLVSTADARRLNAAFSTKVGQEMVFAYGAAGRGKSAAVKAFAASPEAAQLEKIGQAAMPGIEKEVMRWADEQLVTLQSAALARVAAQVATMRRSPGSGYPKLVLPEPTGYGPVDQLVAVQGALAQDIASARHELPAKLHTLGGAPILQPAGLVTAKGLKKARDGVELYNQAIDAYVSDLRGAMERARTSEQLKTGIAAYDKGIDALADEWDAKDDAIAAWQTSQRAQLYVMRRILSFAEARIGKLTVAGNALVMADKADQALYQAMLDELALEIKNAAPTL